MSYKAIAKDPSNYEEREIEKNEQALIDISISIEVVRLWLKLLQKNKQKKENT